MWNIFPFHVKHKPKFHNQQNAWFSPYSQENAQNQAIFKRKISLNFAPKNFLSLKPYPKILEPQNAVKNAHFLCKILVKNGNILPDFAYKIRQNVCKISIFHPTQKFHT